MRLCHFRMQAAAPYRGVRSRNLMRIFFRIWFLITFIFVCVLPFYWSAQQLEVFYSLGNENSYSYFDMLELYLPEIVLSVASFIFMVLLIANKKIARFGIWLFAIVVYPLLKWNLGSPTYNVWIFSTGLLVVLCLLDFKNSNAST